jgi:ABC-type uncharacterized transport system substrate-binding protein
MAAITRSRRSSDKARAIMPSVIRTPWNHSGGPPATSVDSARKAAALAPLAKTNVDSLAEFGYFTIVKASGKQGEFGDPVDYWLEEGSDRLVTLHFTLPLKIPASAARVLTLSVYDPTYFVAFSLAEKDPVALRDGPSGCSASVSKPKVLDAADTQRLNESYFSNLSPGVDFGIKLAERAIVACP